MNCFPPSTKIRTAAHEIQTVNFTWKKRWGHLKKWGYTGDRTYPDEAIQQEPQGRMETMQTREFSSILSSCQVSKF